METIKKENMDIYDIAAIVIMDIHDMMTAPTKESFRKFVLNKIKNFEERITALERENKILKELLENEDIVLEVKDDDIVASKKS